MSLNLTVPTDSPNATSKPRVQRRAKSPSTAALASKNAQHRNSGISVNRNVRAKSKSPNPSFCSVLSRVKDWELGAFTPKTALADNIGSTATDNSEVSNNLLCPSQDPDQRSSATPWLNDGSPEPKDQDGNQGAKLMKSNLSSNIGRRTIYFYYSVTELRSLTNAPSAALTPWLSKTPAGAPVALSFTLNPEVRRQWSSELKSKIF